MSQKKKKNEEERRKVINKRSKKEIARKMDRFENNIFFQGPAISYTILKILNFSIYPSRIQNNLE